MGLLRHHSNMYWITEMPQGEHLFEGLFMRLVVMASRPGEGMCPNSTPSNCILEPERYTDRSPGMKPAI